MKRCAALLAAVLALDARAVDDYANAQFRVLHDAPCLSVRQNMSAQFDDYEPFTGNGYPDDRTYFVVRHIGEPGSVELRGQIGSAVRWNPGALTGLQLPQALRA